MTPPTLKQIIEKATPGPWEMEPHPADRTLHVYGPKPRCRLIAELWPESKHDGAELAANADLIARCSPSVMLAVVEALEVADSLCTTFGSSPDDCDDDERNGWKKIRRALSLLNDKSP